MLTRIYDCAYGEGIEQPLGTKQMTKSLNLDNDAAFFRGIEMADEKTFAAFVTAICQMRAQNTYSNQDLDKRTTTRSVLNALRTVGNTPLPTLGAA